MSGLTKRGLRELVANRVGVNWLVFAENHPHLARAIDRSVLIEQVIERLGSDEDFQRAMAQAATDEAALRATGEVSGRVIDLIDLAVRRVLRF